MDLRNVIYSLLLISPNVFLALEGILFNESHGLWDDCIASNKNAKVNVSVGQYSLRIFKP